MNRHDIQAVMAKEPLLTCSGMGNPSASDFQKERDRLLEEVEGCTLTEAWVKRLTKTSTFNRKHSSYVLKHVLERTVGYCTNGAFIAAMIHCGFDYKRCREHGQNVWFNVSEQSLKEIVHELDPQHDHWVFGPFRAAKRRSNAEKSGVRKKDDGVRYAGNFYVENTTANSRDTPGGLMIATLNIGIRYFNQQHELEKSPLTCSMVGDGEIDYEINQLQKQLETIRREAKKLLVKHRKDDEEYFRRYRLLRPPGGPPEHLHS
jgi:hypothetical protein